MADDNQDLFTPGEHFHGYVIERLLGKGGVGAVYLARHELLDTLYAIKVLYPDLAQANPSYIGRFLREAKIATRVHHPNMVAVHDCGHDSDKHLYYLVMDFVVCGDLRQAIGLTGRFPVGEALDIIAQAASALSAMQRYGVVHRDIKPENILLQKDGTIKLVDLGIAKATNLGETTMTTSHAVFGTPAYTSPEQARDASKVDTRADVYSLGLVLFELLAGETPYKGLSPMKTITSVLSDEPTPALTRYVDDLPHAVVSLVSRMTEKDRDKRLESPARVVEEIAKLGYPLHLAQSTEYVPTGKESLSGDDVKYDVYDEKKSAQAIPTMDFAGGDPVMLAFLKKRKRKAALRKFGPIVGAVILLVVGLVLVVAR